MSDLQILIKRKKMTKLAHYELVPVYETFCIYPAIFCFDPESFRIFKIFQVQKVRNSEAVKLWGREQNFKGEKMQ